MNEQTRYRLIGAIFLLALASIVLPIVFDGSGVRVEQVRPIDVELPELPSAAELNALTINQEQSAASRAEIDAARAPFDDEGYAVTDGTRLGDPGLREVDAATDVQPPVVGESPQGAQANHSTAEGSEEPTGAGVITTAASGPNWAVQLASFANSANAQAFRDRLNRDGYQAWLTNTKRNGNLRTRVAIGPLPDKATAQRLVAEVSKRYDLEALLVEMTP